MTDEMTTQEYRSFEVGGESAASGDMTMRSWYMPKASADRLTALVDDVHFSTRLPKYLVMDALVNVADRYRAEVEAEAQATGPDAVTQARGGSEENPRPAPAGERGKPTRITVDLAAELYSYLRGYARGRDIAAADVVRELIRQMRNDPDLSARVTAELARRQEALAEAKRAARE